MKVRRAHVRPPRLFRLCKWYIDTLLDDGTVLLVYLGKITLAGVPLVRVTADLFSPLGRVSSSAAGGLLLEQGPCAVRCGSAEIQGDELRWETPAISGRLRFAARHAPVTLRQPFLSQAGRSLEWCVEVPDADVIGELKVEGRVQHIQGRGYRDRVSFDIAPWNLPLRRLHWGRVAAGPHAATWVQADTADGRIEAGWHDGALIPSRPPQLELRGERELLAGPVVDLEGLHLGPLRPLLRAITRNPFQRKWTALAVLQGAVGHAVHETVEFGAG